ncbi:MAG: aquaporin [Candidatus Limnocylindrales bacterium]
MGGMLRRDWNAVITEGVGTFLFFFVGMGAAVAAGGSLVTVALAHGLVLAVLVSSLGAVSGAHFNPAVTFAVWISGNLDGRRAIAYILAQCIGGIVAGVALASFYPIETGLGLPALATGLDPGTGLFIEAILTAVLLVAVFGTAIDPRAPKVGGIAIGFAVGGDILMGGPLTGAAMNPARWLGPAITTNHLENAHVWILGPIIGALLIALLYRSILKPEANVERTSGDPQPEDDIS